MDKTELQIKQAEGEISEAELEAILELKRRAEGKPIPIDRKRAIKSARRKPKEVRLLDYQGLTGRWLHYIEVASKFERHIPLSDRDDYRHDVVCQLDREEKRIGKPLPELKAYRIASIMIALYYRERNRFATRVCVYSGNPVVPHCEACPNSTGKPCAWLAVRPIARLDTEIVDDEGYRTTLIDTIASENSLDMPDQWYDLKSQLVSLPIRLVEIGYKRWQGKPLDAKDRMYLLRYWKAHQKRLF